MLPVGKKSGYIRDVIRGQTPPAAIVTPLISSPFVQDQLNRAPRGFPGSMAISTSPGEPNERLLTDRQLQAWADLCEFERPPLAPIPPAPGLPANSALVPALAPRDELSGPLHPGLRNNRAATPPTWRANITDATANLGRKQAPSRMYPRTVLRLFFEAKSSSKKNHALLSKHSDGQLTLSISKKQCNEN